MTSKRVVLTLVLGLLLAVHLERPRAQSAPTGLPRVFPQDLTYLGSFSLPDQDGRGGQLNYGGDALGLSADGQTLYFSCIYGTSLAQVAIPAVGERARLIAPCEQIPNLKAVNPTDPNNSAGGVLAWNGRLIVSGYSTYDAAKLAKASHFAGTSIATLRGPVTMGTQGAGIVAGYMGVVPVEWRGALGGAALSGQCCISIISRSSFGPSVSAFDPSQLDGTGNVSATMLVGYPDGHTTLGPYESAGPFWGGATRVGGVAFPAGTRSVLFVGRVGTTFCYGHGTTDRSRHGQPDPAGSRWCFDPTNQYQGTHGYPYKHQIWAYDASDLAAVARGERAPWDVTPYAAWTLSEMSPGGGVAEMHGATYDPVARRLYVTASTAPVVHVYEVTAGVSGVPTEVCGDGLDNDGNGQVDEGCPPPDTMPPGPPAPPPERPGGGSDEGGGNGGGDGGGSDGGSDRGGESGDGGDAEDPGAPKGRDPFNGGMLPSTASAVAETTPLATAGAAASAVAVCDGRVHVAFGDAALHYRASFDDGRAWHDAIGFGDGRPAGSHALACEGSVVALAARRDSAIWVWTSVDGGDSWTRPVRIADDATGEAVVAVHDASVTVAWTGRTVDGWRLEARRQVDGAWLASRVVADGRGEGVPAIALDSAGRLLAWQIDGSVRTSSPWETGATAGRFAATGALLDATASGPLVVDAGSPAALAQVNDAGRLVGSAPVSASVVTIDAAEVADARVAASWSVGGQRVVALSIDGGRSWRASGLAVDGTAALATAPDGVHAVVVDDRGALHYARLRVAPE